MPSGSIATSWPARRDAAARSAVRRRTEDTHRAIPDVARHRVRVGRRRRSGAGGAGRGHRSVRREHRAGIGPEPGSMGPPARRRRARRERCRGRSAAANQRTTARRLRNAWPTSRRDSPCSKTPSASRAPSPSRTETPKAAKSRRIVTAGVTIRRNCGWLHAEWMAGSEQFGNRAAAIAAPFDSTSCGTTGCASCSVMSLATTSGSKSA